MSFGFCGEQQKKKKLHFIFLIRCIANKKQSPSNDVAHFSGTTKRFIDTFLIDFFPFVNIVHHRFHFHFQKHQTNKNPQ